jgi:hypothetical protein
MTETPPYPPWTLVKITSGGSYHLDKPPGCKGELTEEEIVGQGVLVDISDRGWVCGEENIPSLTEWCDECLKSASKFYAEKNYS